MCETCMLAAVNGEPDNAEYLEDWPMIVVDTDHPRNEWTTCQVCGEVTPISYPFESMEAER